jgi:hypothetical protein
VAEAFEEVVRFRFPRDATPPVTSVRSTLLAASRHTIRTMGWEERYLAVLPKELNLELQMLTAGSWVSLELATLHYTACDAMKLDPHDMNAIGADVSLRTQRTFIGTLGKAASGAGATPWLLLGNVHRIWDRMFEGGDNSVYKIGPKEALVLLQGCPLLELTYFRVGFLAYYRALAAILSRVAYTKESPMHRERGRIGFRISWV